MQKTKKILIIKFGVTCIVKILLFYFFKEYKKFSATYYQIWVITYHCTVGIQGELWFSTKIQNLVFNGQYYMSVCIFLPLLSSVKYIQSFKPLWNWDHFTALAKGGIIRAWTELTERYPTGFFPNTAFAEKID